MSQHSPGRSSIPFWSISVLIFFVFICCHGEHHWWHEVFQNFPDPRFNASSCGLSIETTQYSICDPDRTLDSTSQERLADKLRTLQATRYHECDNGATPPIKLAIMLGSSDFASDVLIPKIDFSEQVVELMLGKATSTEKERACGSYVGAFISTKSCPPLLTIRCDRAKEPLIPETEYPAIHDALFKKMRLSESCLELHSTQPPSRSSTPLLSESKHTGGSSLSFLQLFVSSTSTSATVMSLNTNTTTGPQGSVSLETAVIDMINFFMDKFPVRVEPLRLPPAQEKIEEVEELVEVEVIEDGKVVKKKIPQKRNIISREVYVSGPEVREVSEEEAAKLKLKTEKPGTLLRNPLKIVAGEVTETVKGAEELAEAVEKGIPAAPRPLTKNMWRYLVTAIVCAVVYTVVMEILHQILIRRMKKYAVPYSSEINVDVLALAAASSEWQRPISPRKKSSRRRKLSSDTREAFGDRGHPRSKRRQSSSQPPGG